MEGTEASAPVRTPAMPSSKPLYVSEERTFAVALIVERNIRALLARRHREDKEKSLEEKIAAAAVTRFTGSMLFVYIHLTLDSLWIVINLGWIPFVPK